MPSKLKKAIGVVKDQTSISLARVVNTNSSNLDVAVLKATTHDKEPIDEFYVNEILQTISTNKLQAAVCANAIAKRIGKTKNWVVALKSLTLVLRIFQEGDRFFPEEVLHARNRGAKILNLSTFRDVSNASPSDYSAFVRSFAFYLEERLDCFLAGKLQRSCGVNRQPVREMKPTVLLDRICYWQRLLDRAIATKPTGEAKTNRLVLVSLYAIVRESFDLYRDISDGLDLLLDSFFQLVYQSCVDAFHYCVTARRQFEELSSFYGFVKSLGIGRTSEYPSVQKISDELMETLQEFLKDQPSFPSSNPPPANDHSETAKGESQAGSRCTFMEDLASQTESVGTISPSFSVGHFSELSEKQCHEEDMYDFQETGSNHSLPIDPGANVTIDFVAFDAWPTVDETQGQLNSEISDSTNGQNLANDDYTFFEDSVQQQDHKQEQACENGVNGLSFVNNWLQEDLRKEQASEIGTMGNSYTNDWLQGNQQLELEEREDKKEPEERKQYAALNSSNGGVEGWELVLVEAATQSAQASQHDLANGIEHSMANDLFDQTPIVPERQYNPFLEDETDISASIATTTNENAANFPDEFPMASTFQAAPTFQATTAFQDHENDPFAQRPTMETNNNVSTDGSVDQENVLLQQQLWLQNQNKIMARHIL